MEKFYMTQSNRSPASMRLFTFMFMLPDSAFILIAAQMKPRITAMTAQPNAFPTIECQSILENCTFFHVEKSQITYLYRLERPNGNEKNLPNEQSDGQNGSESAPHKRFTRLCPQPNGCRNKAINTHIAMKSNGNNFIFMMLFCR